MPTLNHSFNVMLSDELFQNLGLLALSEGVSKGQLVRRLITHLAKMRLSRIPLCATGRECFMPHLHTFASSVAPQTPTQEPPPPHDPTLAP